MLQKAANMEADSIRKLLIRQSILASIGILVMSLNILIDTIFVGQWIGSNAIAAINVVLPVSFFIRRELGTISKAIMYWFSFLSYFRT